MLFKISLCISLSIVYCQAASLKRSESQLDRCQSLDQRAKKIKDSFDFAYKGYQKYAFGHDELLPVSNSFYDSRNGWGASIVDSLDTMLIMGFDDYYNEALEFVKKIDFSYSKESSKGFETNIRYLGGLLAANELKPNPILVQKAVEVTEYALLPLFVDTTSQGQKVKVPYTYMNMIEKQPETTNHINLAEFGTYSMEFTRLSQVTGDPKYEKLVNDMTNAAIRQPTLIPGLFPSSWTVKPFAPINSSIITLGGGGDSFYEYLIKNYILQNKENKALLSTWQDSVESAETYMLSPTAEDPTIKFVAQIGNDKMHYSAQELFCYCPGNILLGISQVEDLEKKTRYRNFADTIFDSCIETWKKTETGIAPESWGWNPQSDDLDVKLSKLVGKPLNMVKQASHKKTAKRNVRSFRVADSSYDLRPETIESIFYYYRLTGDSKYQDLAWELYLAIDKYAKSNSGYARVNDVDKTTISVSDFEESFFFAETLKYLYLIFTDKECISLNDYVFNTEAHPFKLSTSIQYQ